MTHEELLSLIDSGNRIALDLGCGPSKKPGYLGIDKLSLPAVDYVADIESGLSFLPDNSIDEIYPSNFKFNVIKQKLIFKSPPFYFRNLFRQLLQRILNSSIYMQELYKDVFFYIFACQELYARLTPVK